MTNARQSKKSETIEIRVDYQTKSSLYAKARAEGRSVSEVLRDLIARYLGAGAPSATWSGSLMQYSSMAAAAVALVALVTFVPAAMASDVLVGVTARMETGANEIIDPRVPEARFEARFGDPLVLCIPRSAPARVVQAAPDRSCAFDAQSGYIYTLWVDPAANGKVRLTWEIERPNGATLGAGPDGRPAVSIPLGQGTESLSYINGSPEAVRVAVLVDQP